MGPDVKACPRSWVHRCEGLSSVLGPHCVSLTSSLVTLSRDFASVSLTQLWAGLASAVRLSFEGEVTSTSAPPDPVPVTLTIGHLSSPG